MYNLAYLPVALKDMVDIVRYISEELHNPTAAERLSAKLISTGESIAIFPYSHPAYNPIRPLKHEYRKMPVQNYLIFYWVDEEKKSVTVARVIYQKRNYKAMLK